MNLLILLILPLLAPLPHIVTTTQPYPLPQIPANGMTIKELFGIMKVGKILTTLLLQVRLLIIIAIRPMVAVGLKKMMVGNLRDGILNFMMLVLLMVMVILPTV